MFEQLLILQELPQVGFAPIVFPCFRRKAFILHHKIVTNLVCRSSSFDSLLLSTYFKLFLALLNLSSMFFLFLSDSLW
jgi:hypothetical protein